VAALTLHLATDELILHCPSMWHCILRGDNVCSHANTPGGVCSVSNLVHWWEVLCAVLLPQIFLASCVDCWHCVTSTLHWQQVLFVASATTSPSCFLSSLRGGPCCASHGIGWLVPRTSLLCVNDFQKLCGGGRCWCQIEFFGGHIKRKSTWGGGIDIVTCSPLMFVPDLNFVDKMTNLWQLGKEGTNKKYITINLQVVQQKNKKRIKMFPTSLEVGWGNVICWLPCSGGCKKYKQSAYRQCNQKQKINVRRHPEYVQMWIIQSCVGNGICPVPAVVDEKNYKTINLWVAQTKAKKWIHVRRCPDMFGSVSMEVVWGTDILVIASAMQLKI